MGEQMKQDETGHVRKNLSSCPS